MDFVSLIRSLYILWMSSTEKGVAYNVYSIPRRMTMSKTLTFVVVGRHVIIGVRHFDLLIVWLRLIFV